MKNLEFFASAIDNIEEVQNVNAITTCHSVKDDTVVLCAHMTDGAKIRLTKGTEKENFPLEPLYQLTRNMGSAYTKNFKDVDVNKSNNYCVNKNNFKNFSFSKQEGSPFVSVFASFNNGEDVNLFGLKEKFFESQGKAGLLAIENEIRDYQIENGIALAESNENTESSNLSFELETDNFYDVY